MANRNAFGEFAPAILKIYRRDKEAFWAAAMAPFLSDSPLLGLWEHRKVGLDLAPGVDAKHTTPEDIARTPLPHVAFVLRREPAAGTLSELTDQMNRRVRVGLRQFKRRAAKVSGLPL